MNTELIAGVGGGVLASLVSWLLTRGEGAAKRRKDEAKAAAEEVITEKKIDIRLNTIEVVLPRVEATVNETKEFVKSTHETLNDLLLSGRLRLQRDDNK